MKKLSVFLLVMVLAFGVFCTSAQAADNIKITVNGTNVAFTDAKPFVDQNGRTQVPMRALGEALGCDVNYQKIEDDVDLTEVITVSKTTPKNLIIRSNLIRYTYPKYGAGEWSKVIQLYAESPVIEDFSVYYDQIYPDTTPVSVNDRTYLPARYIAESFGYSVDWDGSTNTVVVNTDLDSVFYTLGAALPKTALERTWYMKDRPGGKITVGDGCLRFYNLNYNDIDIKYDEKSGAAYARLGENRGLSILLLDSEHAIGDYRGMHDADIYFLQLGGN